MSAGEYEALPEGICRRIGIADGAIVVDAAPRRLHQDICRRLANALETASGPAVAVSADVDLRPGDMPLPSRRADAVLHDASLPGGAPGTARPKGPCPFPAAGWIPPPTRTRAPGVIPLWRRAGPTAHPAPHAARHRGGQWFL